MQRVRPWVSGLLLLGRSLMQPSHRELWLIVPAYEHVFAVRSALAVRPFTVGQVGSCSRPQQDAVCPSLCPNSGRCGMQSDAPPAAFDRAWVDAFVERLSDFDARMNQDVVDSGVLAGVPRGALARAGASQTASPGPGELPDSCMCVCLCAQTHNALLGKRLGRSCLSGHWHCAQMMSVQLACRQMLK